METEVSAAKAAADERHARLQAALADAPFDVLVATTPESVFYTTDFRSVSASVFTDYLMAAVISTEATILIVSAGEVAAALDRGVSQDSIFSYGTFFFEGPVAAVTSTSYTDFPTAVAAAISSVVQPNSVIAVEAPLRTAAVASELDSDAMDATDWISALRAIKTPGERALLKTAVSITEHGIRAGIDAIRVGASESEVAELVAAAMASRGGLPRFVVVTAGQRSALSDAHATRQIIKDGDLVRFDIGCVYQGYWSDIARTAVVGSTNSRQATFYAALRAGVQAQIEQAQPGLTAGELFDIAINTVRAQGITNYRRHHVGHAIGLSVYERPVITAAAPTVLQSGMVLCLETPYYEIGWGGMMLEEAGVITDNGFEMFTTLDDQLWVVPR